MSATRTLSLLGFLIMTLSACSSHLPLNTGSTLDRLERADNAFRAGQIEQAKRHYQTVIKRSPEMVSPHFQLGRIAYRDAQLDQAKTHFANALERNPNHIPATYNLAIIHLQTARTLLAKHQTLAPLTAARPELKTMREAIEALANPAKPAESLDR